MKQHEDKIEYLIANEARQKRVAVLSVVVFVVAAAAIIILSLRIITLQRKNRGLKEDKVSLTREIMLQDSIIKLQTALFERFQDSLSQSRIIEQQQDYLDAGIAQVEIPEQQLQTVPPPYSKIKIQAKPPAKTSATVQPGSAGKTPFQPQEPQVKTASKALPPVTPGSAAPVYTVYIQYAASMKSQQQLLQKALQQKAMYKVPAAELISGQHFGASIRYFRKDDAAAARQLAAIASQRCGLNFAVQFVPLKAPPGQLEVWVGDGK